MYYNVQFVAGKTNNLSYKFHDAVIVDFVPEIYVAIEGFTNGQDDSID